MEESALEGIRVIECSFHLNGPFAGRLLAELGAEVIKVEPPDGEPNRHNSATINGESTFFMNYNANKKFITLNLKSARGKEIFLDLIKKSDVFLDNFRPGVMDRLGLGYEIQKKYNPSLIYASSTGFGYTGPYRNDAAYDTTIQALSGMMDLTGFPGDPPIRAAPAIMDLSAGTYTALSILAALHYRDRTGHGQRIDIAMFDVAVNYMIGLYSQMQVGNVVKQGNAIPVLAPYNVYRTKDGWVVIVIGDDAKWRLFLEKIGESDYLEDERLMHLQERTKNAGIVDKIVSSWSINNTSEYAVNLVLECGGAACEVRKLEELPDDPQVKARNMIVDTVHPVVGNFRTIGSALKMSETPGRVVTPGLPLGYNNTEVYRKMLNFSDNQISDLKKKGVI
ncbi:CoA transferase [Ferroplasma sp.]|uniref:CaiB/BaiF CoA transferase family protein n=1 Tax=Ferroplasma sp. TaxID=2591003 RepID=UPI00261E9B2C|nr:CoA transferase [Ferroplasma sp.]MCL4453199.1 CoA transferase [Candidatus Thermoplasmatota archaeon]